jgi:phosphate acetyltransferase
MSKLISALKARAAMLRRTIVLPETSDLRVLQAAEKSKSFSDIVLLGKKDRLYHKISENKMNLQGIKVIDSSDHLSLAEELGGHLYARRKGKEFHSKDEAINKVLNDPLYFGNCLLACGYVHGQVAGSIATTADVVRSALHCLGTKRGLASSFILLVKKEKVMLFSDCGLVINPTSNQLAEIAVATAAAAKDVLGIEIPKVAMLSFSTKGSAEHAMVDKLREAVNIARSINPELLVDGEMQFDAAMVPEVAKIKAPKSEVAGSANVLIFPDLNAGNIGYKIAQRLGGFEAIGPILQGFKKPSNDLSRGCSATDIENSVIITSLQVDDNTPLKTIPNIEIL